MLDQDIVFLLDYLAHLLVSHVVCDGTFFPSLLKEMSIVVGCFNQRAQKLLEMHLASGFLKYFAWFSGNSQQNHETLMQEGKDLVTYAIINSVAMRKILKKYDKVCHLKITYSFFLLYWSYTFKVRLCICKLQLCNCGYNCLSVDIISSKLCLL